MWSILKFGRIATIFVALLFVPQWANASPAQSCTYETWDWDTIQRKAVNHHKVKKLKSELSSDERGQTEGCTVCEEDQVLIQIDKLPSFKICRAFQDRFERAISKAVLEGFPITSIVGYRVGKSKGPLNAQGQRTQFSNHSFGTAIDFNSEKNGLYDFCVQFGPQCKLLRGGEYRSGTKGAITKSSSLYKAMIAEGFKWGGEISGKQKDFMHFSQNGM